MGEREKADSEEHKHVDAKTSTAHERDVYEGSRAKIQETLAGLWSITDTEEQNGCRLGYLDGSDVVGTPFSYRLDYQEKYTVTDKKPKNPFATEKEYLTTYRQHVWIVRFGDSKKYAELVSETLDGALDLLVARHKARKEAQNESVERERESALIKAAHDRWVESEEKKHRALLVEIRRGRDPRLADPKYLPSIAEVNKNYPIVDHRIYSQLSTTEVDPQTGITPWHREGMAWRDFFIDQFRKHEILTREYISKLSDYLIGRADSLRTKYPDRKITILEIGAGDGRLTYFLNEFIKEQIPEGIDIVATDPDAHNESNSFGQFPLKIAGYEEAIDTYQPQIVISSWMPLGIDFTVGIRKKPCVAEYILIGIPNDDTVGKSWESWGNAAGATRNVEEETPPYAKDGFEQVVLNMGKQINLNAPYDWFGSRESVTYSFRRM